MNKKPNNRSGFTLVELIVVMCLMGIIMGAVLNFIRPTASLYKTTNTYLSEESATSTIYSFLQDDLMYATGIYVCSSNESDINVVAQQINNNLSGESMTLSNCIRLDNVSVRQDTDKAIAKNSTGSIQKYARKSNGLYVDVTDPAEQASLLGNVKLYTNSFGLKNQAFMDDDKYVFSVKTQPNAGVGGIPYSITVNMDVYAPAYSSSAGGYVYDELTFSASKSIEFVNISSNIKDSLAKFEATDPDDDYIYIFYTRRDKIQTDASRIKYICYVKQADTNQYIEAGSGREAEGTNITEAVVACEQNYLPEYDYNGYHYELKSGVYSYQTPADHWVDGGNYYDLTNLYSIDGNDVKLYAVYAVTKLSDMPGSSVIFWHDYDGTNYNTETTVKYGEAVTTFPDFPDGHNQSAPFYTGILSVDGSYKTKYEWCLIQSTTPASFNYITHETNVYPHAYTEYRVRFFDPDGNEIPSTTVFVRENGMVASLPDLTAYAHDDFTYEWDFDLATPIAAPTDIYTKEIDNSVPPAPEVQEITVIPPGAPNRGEMWTGSKNEPSVAYNLDLKNTSGGILKNGTIVVKVKFTGNVVAPPWNGPSADWTYITNFETSYGGDTLTITMKINNVADNQWNAFRDGSVIKLTNIGGVVGNNSVAIDSVTVTYTP